MSTEQHILDFIAGKSSQSFDDLALEVFAYQYERNTVYRAYCDRLGVEVRHWRDIPAVPTSAFKDFTLTCFPVETAVAEFHTSGTTQAKAGKHYFRTLALYDAASVPNFRAHLFPDGIGLPIVSLVPDNPHSSLAHMIRTVGGRYVERLATSEAPVCVVGTAFHFMNLFDAGLKLRFPAGSRVMETGGFKGRSRAVSRKELYALFENRLGIPAAHVVNEYGMTELSTQFYDETMVTGTPTDVKRVPPWARVVIIDPHNGKEAIPDARGLIRIVDIANLDSAMVVQTEDLGAAVGDGFRILGRAAGSEVRGCSLSAESLWQQ